MQSKVYSADDLILGTIWEPFNMFEIETSIKAPIDRWSRDVGPHL
jgi:hypothetical protein